MDRQQILENLKGETQTFDVVVVGGGITGAGVGPPTPGTGIKKLRGGQKKLAGGTTPPANKNVQGGQR
ncbi:MAG: FAD-dependent oxidoreductase, partial [Pseudomonadota bacterium]|nr:FAD-dependent oxidoreductase [Pseudomonadota bacterium]